jgi:hypothetical protein
LREKILSHLHGQSVIIKARIDRFWSEHRPFFRELLNCGILSISIIETFQFFVITNSYNFHYCFEKENPIVCYMLYMNFSNYYQ